MPYSDFSEKTLAAIAWCDTYAVALSAFLEQNIHPTQLRKQAMDAWLVAREEDPIQAAKRDWIAAKVEPPTVVNASKQETLPGPLIG